MSITSFRTVGLLAATGLVVLLAAAPARAQSDIENAISYYGEENIRGYIQPLADLYGAGINSGFYRSAAISSVGFQFNLDIVGFGALVADDSKLFSAKLPAGFSDEVWNQPTIVGPRAELVTDGSGAQYKGSDGMVDASLFPYGVAQLTLGGVKGTEAFFRFTTTPEISSGKYPKTTLVGGGVRHNVSQYLVDPPLDVAVGFSYNTLSIGEILDVKGILVGAQGSRSWNVFTLYGGAAWEKSTLTLEYTSTGVNPGPVKIELDGDNSFRITAGGLLQLGFFKLFADANIGSVTAFSGGIGFGN